MWRQGEMKDIRIFVASSKELERERNELAFLVLEREEAFAERWLRVRLAKWEYVDPKMTEGRTEDRYLDEMYDCDAAFVLFRDIAGMYTREELDKALAREREGTTRLKAHAILFAADGKPGADAARLRASLPEGSYGTWSDTGELREAIGDYAFAGCTALASIVIPEGVEKIGHWAFSECRGLREIAFPEGLKHIGGRAFEATGVQTLTLPSMVEEVGKEAFAECADLVSVLVPQGLQVRKNVHFPDCPKLKEIMRY